MSVVPVMHVDLPVPPSANNLFFTARNGRRVRSSEYNAWRVEADLLLHGAWLLVGKPQIGKHWGVTIRAGINHQRDLDNVCKPILDAIVRALPTPGDQWCDRIELDREGPQGRAYVTIIGGAL